MLVRLKQLGCTPIQAQITLDLKDLTIVPTKELDDISLVCVEFKRGSKTITTGSKLVPEGCKVIRFDESLCLLMTLYRSASGSFLEKKGRLVVVGHSKSTRSAVILGSIDLKLDRLAGNFARQSLSLSLGIGHLNCTVIPKYLGSGMVDADNSSLMSGEDGASSIMRSRVNSSESHQHDVSFAAVYRDPTERLFVQERPQRLQFSNSSSKTPISTKTTMSPNYLSPNEQIAQLEAKLAKAQMQVTVVEAEKREILERQNQNNSIETSNGKSGLGTYSTPNKYPYPTSSHNSTNTNSVSKLSPKAAQLMSMSGKKPNTLTSSSSRRSSQQQQQQQGVAASSQRHINSPEGYTTTPRVSNERMTPFSPSSSQRNMNSSNERSVHRDQVTNETPSSNRKMTPITSPSPSPIIINDSLIAMYTQQLRDTKSKEDLRALLMKIQAQLTFQHQQLEEREHDIRTLQATMVTLHDDMYAAQVRANDDEIRHNRDKEILQDSLVKMKASALALNEENETLLVDVEQLRKQSNHDQEKYNSMEKRCRTELIEAQEHLAISVTEMEKLEKEVEIYHAKVTEYQSEKITSTQKMADMQSLQEENTQNQKKLVKFEAQMMDLCDQIASLESEKEALLMAQITSENLIHTTQQDRDTVQTLAEQINTLETSLQQQTRKCTEKDDEIKGLKHQLTTNEEHSKYRNEELLKELRQTRGQLGKAEHDQEMMKWKVQSLEQDIDALKLRGNEDISHASINQEANVQLARAAESREEAMRTKLMATEDLLQQQTAELNLTIEKLSQVSMERDVALQKCLSHSSITIDLQHQFQKLQQLHVDNDQPQGNEKEQQLQEMIDMKDAVHAKALSQLTKDLDVALVHLAEEKRIREALQDNQSRQTAELTVNYITMDAHMMAINELQNQLNEKEAMSRLAEENRLRELALQDTSNRLPPSLPPVPYDTDSNSANFETIAMKLIDVQERESKRIAELARIQGQLTEKHRSEAAKAEEVAKLQKLLEIEQQKLLSQDKELIERCHELKQRDDEIIRLEAVLAVATEQLQVMDGTDAEITQLQLSLTSMKTDQANIERLQSLFDDSIRQCTEQEKELITIKKTVSEMQQEKGVFVEKMAELEAQLAERNEALKLSAEEAKEQANDVRHLFAEEESRHLHEKQLLEQQNELYKSQVTAVEAELHALITAYSTVKQKNDTEKVTLMKTKEKESKGDINHDQEDPLSTVDQAVSEEVFGEEVMRLTSENGKLKAQLEHMRVQWSSEEQRFKRQVELLLAENQSLCDDLLNAEAQMGNSSPSSMSRKRTNHDDVMMDGDVNELNNHDRDMLLHELLHSRQQIKTLNEKLLEVKKQSKKSALETLAMMEEKMIQLENELEQQHTKHELQIVKILKATGLYEKSGYEKLKSEPFTDAISDSIVDIFRQFQDDERLKVMALKSVLVQFTHKLSDSDLATLLSAGVVMVPNYDDVHHKPKQRGLGINFGSALCISPSL